MDTNLNKAEYSQNIYLNELFFDCSEEGLVIHENGLIKLVNPAICKLLGYERAEVLGANVLNYIDTRDRDKVIEKIKTGYEKQYEARLIHKNGNVIFVELIGKNTQIEGKDRIVLVKDVTSRKKLEKDLLKKNSSLEFLINNLPGIVFKCLVNDNWTMVFMSRQCESILGYSAEELINDAEVSFVSLIHEDQQMVQEVVMLAVAERRPYQITYRIKTKTGDIKWVMEQGSIINDAETEEDYIEGFICDITPLKILEEELTVEKDNYKDLSENLELLVEKRTLQLKEKNDLLSKQAEEIHSNLTYIEEINSELANQKEELTVSVEEMNALNSALSAMYKALNDVMIISVIDLEGNIIEVNKMFCEVSQYETAELIGQTYHVINSNAHPEDYFKEMWLTISEGKIWRGEVCYKRKDGTFYWVDNTFAPFLDEEGKPFKYLSVKFLVDDYKDIEGKLRENNKQVTQSIEYAKLIQETLMPPLVTIKKYFRDAFMIYKPKDIVSGDFVWFYHDNNKGISYLSVVDCTGHGVPGGFMSMLGVVLLDHIVYDRNICRTDIVLEELDRSIIRLMNKQHKTQKLNDSMDMAFLAVDHDNCTITYSAANNPFYLVRDNEVIEYKSDKYSVGHDNEYITSNKEFSKTVFNFQKGDVIYLFSDGYKDQINGKTHRRYMRSAFKDLLLSVHHLPMTAQREILLREFNVWRSGFFQVDDVTVLGIRL